MVFFIREETCISLHNNLNCLNATLSSAFQNTSPFALRDAIPLEQFAPWRGIQFLSMMLALFKNTIQVLCYLAITYPFGVWWVLGFALELPLLYIFVFLYNTYVTLWQSNNWLWWVEQHMNFGCKMWKFSIICLLAFYNLFVGYFGMGPHSVQSERRISSIC